MADRIQAVGAYRPRVVQGPTVQRRELVAFIARSTGLTEGGIALVLYELRDTVVYNLQYGRAVKLEGLGTYFPSVGLDGVVKAGHRLDVYIRNALRAPGGFHGEIAHRENLGKTPDELVALWNADHPEDPIP